MSHVEDTFQSDTRQGLLLSTLQQLLAIEAVQVKPALDQAAQLLIDVLGAEKVDVFLYDPTTTSLVAMGVSDTPLGHHQQKLGLDRLQIANRGSTVNVFLTGAPYITGRADQDEQELIGLKNPPPEGLGVMSTISVLILVRDERRGVLAATSNKPNFFTQQDVLFLEAAAHWIGMVIHRAELVEQQAREALEQGREQAAEQLLTIMAHDLRNYLTPLKARLDFIARRARRDQREQDIRDCTNAQKTFEQVTRLITNLLDVARLKQGLFIIQRQPVDLVETLQRIVSAMSAPQTIIHVQAPARIEMEADPDRLQQILDNLLANAIKHAPADTSIEVKATQEYHDGKQWACVTVSNQGPAIPLEIQEHLFQPFVTGPGSSGLGLGLYLAHEIALAHNGNLTVYSPPQGGTHFTLTLPIFEDA